MTGLEKDDDFEAYLKRRSLVRDRLNGLDQPHPPEELDRIVLNKARQAIQRAPEQPLFRAPRWALAVGLAATLVLSFSVLLNLGLRPKPTAEQESVTETTVVTQTPSPVMPDIAPAPEIAPPANMAHADMPAPSSPARRSYAPKTRALAKAPAPSAPEAKKMEDANGAEQLQKRVQPAAPPPPVAASAARPSDEFVASRDAQAAQPNAGASGPAQANVDAAQSPERKSRASADSAARAPAESAADSGTTGRASDGPAWESDPASWLRHIDALRAAGKTAEAEQELRRFHKAYPAYSPSR